MTSCVTRTVRPLYFTCVVRVFKVSQPAAITCHLQCDFNLICVNAPPQRIPSTPHPSQVKPELPLLPNLLSSFSSILHLDPSSFLNNNIFQVFSFLQLIYPYICSSWLSSTSLTPSWWSCNFCQCGSMVRMDLLPDPPCLKTPMHRTWLLLQTLLFLYFSACSLQLENWSGLHSLMATWIWQHGLFNIPPSCSLYCWRRVAADEFGIKAPVMLTTNNGGKRNKGERLVAKWEVCATHSAAVNKIKRRSEIQYVAGVTSSWER